MVSSPKLQHRNGELSTSTGPQWWVVYSYRTVMVSSPQLQDLNGDRNRTANWLFLAWAQVSGQTEWELGNGGRGRGAGVRRQIAAHYNHCPLETVPGFPRKLQTRQPQIRSAVLTNPRLDTSQTSTSAGSHTRWSGPRGSINGKWTEGKGAQGW